MTVRTVVMTLAGVALVGWLFLAHDPGAIWQALRGTGWMLAIPIALHVPQTSASAIGWTALIDEVPVPGFGFAYGLRWIKEAVNALLPSAQIGGDLVRARLFTRAGGDPRIGLGATMIDIGTELAAQIVFTLGAVLLVVAGPHGGRLLAIALGGAAGLATVVILLVVARRFGVVRVLERLLVRAGRSGRWRSFGRLEGLETVISRIVHQPRRLWLSSGWHLLSWSAGAIETYAALAILGLGPSLREATTIEAMAQCLGAADILVPAALGVREGYYLLIGALIGTAPHDMLALSLVRRAREIVLGIPALLAWQRLERRRASGDPGAAAPADDHRGGDREPGLRRGTGPVGHRVTASRARQVGAFIAPVTGQ